MKILLIYDGEYPWDIRIEKMCKSLVKKKHKVTLCCRNLKGSANQEIGPEGQIILRTPKIFPKKNMKFGEILSFPLFINPIWFYTIIKGIRFASPDVIIVRDLPLTLCAFYASKFFKKIIIMDMAEVYPEGLKSNWGYDKMRFIDYFLRNPSLAELLEKTCIRKVQRIIVVSPESKQRLIKKACDPKSLFIVSNTPEMDKFHPIPASFPGVMSNMQGSFIILFCGIFVGDRGLKIAIKAMPQILQHVSAKLILIGDGPAYDSLKFLIASLNLENQVVFTGWIDNIDLPEYIASADLGILPFMNCSHIRITIANKIFDYMAMNKAFLASDVPPMRRIVEETGAGILFQPENIEDFSSKVIRLASDSAMRQELGQKGLEAVRTKYNWLYDEKKLFQAINW